MGKRRFCKDPSAVRHYRVVHRSMHDDDGNDDDNGQPMTLVSIQPLNSSRKREDAHEDPYKLMATQSHDFPEFEHREVNERGDEELDEDRLKALEELDEEEDADAIDDELAELDDDCYFPKDGYDYSQHLKKMNDRAVIKAEEPKSTPTPIIIADMSVKKTVTVAVADATPAMTKDEIELQEALNAVALEGEDAGYEEFDDHFVEELGIVELDDVTLWGEQGAELAKLNRMAEERKRMYEEYQSDQCRRSETGSMKEEASEMGLLNRRGSQDLRLKKVLGEYGDDDIGELEEDEVHGVLDLDDIEDVLDDYLEGKEEEAEENLVQIFGKNEEIVDRLSPEETMRIVECIEEPCSLSDEEEPYEPPVRWDCETILSTKSNISNHPGKIKLERRKPKLEEVLEEEEPDTDDGECDENTRTHVLPEVILVRSKGETAEEKRSRKAGVREYKRICRAMKKDNKLLYRTEDLKLKTQIAGTGDVRFKTRCIPIS